MEESLRRWEDIHTHILKKILSSSDLPGEGDVFRVCKSWRLCCWDVLFWEKNMLDLSSTKNMLDLSPTMAALGNVHPFSKSVKLRFLSPKNLSLSEGFKHIDLKFMKLLECIMYGNDAFGFSLELWRLSMRNIFIPEDLQISDQHLLYIAESTPRLESIVLLGTSRITRGGFARAVCNWKHVQHISLGKIIRSQCLTGILEEIGKACHELRTLKVSGCLHFQSITAYDAGRNLPKVDRQKFELAYLLREVMNIFLSNCPKLEEIHFGDCFIDYHCTDLLEWSRLSFAIRFGQREKDWRWHFQPRNKGTEQCTESDLLNKFKQWMDEQPPWMELHSWVVVSQISSDPEG